MAIPVAAQGSAHGIIDEFHDSGAEKRKEMVIRRMVNTRKGGGSLVDYIEPIVFFIVKSFGM